MADQPEITLRGAKFDARAVADISRVNGFDSQDADHFRDGVASGLYTLLAVEIDDIRRGSIVLSWEYDDAPVLFCNVLAVDHVHNAEIVPALVDMIAEFAKVKGAGRLRFWTRRPGLVRITEKLGFARNYVMERAV